MKSLILDNLPQLFIEKYQQIDRNLNHWLNRSKPPKEVFTDIYKRNRWGKTRRDFNSGTGTTRQEIVSPYISMVAEKAVAEGFDGSVFVDLGCGDFRVGRQLLPCCSRYIGVDIVELLIKRNKEIYGTEQVTFMTLDIIRDDLPDGDVCFLRQVLQHLSNQQIAAVVGKLDKYKWVFITEHLPADNPAIRPNLDKIHGAHVRVYDNSGVYLSHPPFSLPKRRLEKVLEVRGTGLGLRHDQGVIRTWLYTP